MATLEEMREEYRSLPKGYDWSSYVYPREEFIKNNPTFWIHPNEMVLKNYDRGLYPKTSELFKRIPSDVDITPLILSQYEDWCYHILSYMFGIYNRNQQFTFDEKRVIEYILNSDNGIYIKYIMAYMGAERFMEFVDSERMINDIFKEYVFIWINPIEWIDEARRRKWFNVVAFLNESCENYLEDVLYNKGLKTSKNSTMWGSHSEEKKEEAREYVDRRRIEYHTLPLDDDTRKTFIEEHPTLWFTPTELLLYSDVHATYPDLSTLVSRIPKNIDITILICYDEIFDEVTKGIRDTYNKKKFDIKYVIRHMLGNKYKFFCLDVMISNEENKIKKYYDSFLHTCMRRIGSKVKILMDELTEDQMCYESTLTYFKHYACGKHIHQQYYDEAISRNWTTFAKLLKHIEEDLVNEDKIGKIIKLMKDNIYMWSNSNFIRN